jgi:hypothetical protein
MPNTQWKHLDIFIAAWHATALLYAVNACLMHPNREGPKQWRDQEGEYLTQALDRL